MNDYNYDFKLRILLFINLGDNTTMLFTLNPNINCFNATGYNDHYQYLNLHQETMPNGLVRTY